jgi:hypothetical protein
MSDTLDRPMTDRELALTTHQRKKERLARMDAQAAALLAPVPTWESVAPPLKSKPILPVLTAAEFFARCWFYIEGVSPNGKLSMNQIKAAVRSHYNLPALAMIVGRRDACWMRPRQIAMYLCKELTRNSLPQIGRAFGGADHTTVMNADKRVCILIRKDPDFAAVVAKLRSELEGML